MMRAGRRQGGGIEGVRQASFAKSASQVRSFLSADGSTLSKFRWGSL